jgi:hypothetical protein
VTEPVTVTEPVPVTQPVTVTEAVPVTEPVRARPEPAITEATSRDFRFGGGLHGALGGWEGGDGVRLAGGLGLGLHVLFPLGSGLHLGPTAGGTLSLLAEGEDIVAACLGGAPGASGLDGPCTRTEDCRVGLFCNYGTCRFHCCEDADCPAGQFCSTFDTVGFCSGQDGCDIFGPGCPEGLACYPITLARGGVSPTCFTPGTGVDGDPCTGILACAPGHVCIGNELSAQCRVMCDARHPCASGDCRPIVGDPGYGFCG